MAPTRAIGRHTDAAITTAPNATSNAQTNAALIAPSNCSAAMIAKLPMAAPARSAKYNCPPEAEYAAKARLSNMPAARNGQMQTALTTHTELRWAESGVAKSRYSASGYSTATSKPRLASCEAVCR